MGYVVNLEMLRRSGRLTSLGVGVIATLILMLAIISLLTSPTPVFPQAVTDPGTWSMLGYNPYRISAVTDMNANMNPQNLGVVWSYSSSYSINTNPLVADVDGDGVNEVVVVESSGRLRVFDGSDGALESTYSVFGSAFSTPALANLDADQQLEFLLGTRTGYFLALDNNGNVIWRVRTGHYTGSSPLLCDLNGDGKAEEVVVEARDRTLCINVTTGSVIWESPTGTGGGPAGLGSPTLATDINGDGWREIITINLWGRLYLLDGRTGAVLDSVTFTSNGKTEFLIHNVVVDDVDNDNVLEVIVVSGREIFTYDGSSVSFNGRTGTLRVLTLNNLQVEAAYQLEGFTWFASPAVAAGDINGDGKDEIIVGLNDGTLQAFSHTGSTLTRLWSTALDTLWPGTSGTPALTVALGDINGDGKLEAIAVAMGNAGGMGGMTRGIEYNMYVVDGQGNVIGSISVIADKFSYPSVTLADPDSDSQLEIVLAYGNKVGVYEG